MLGSSVWDNYDQWKLTDVEGQRAWDEVFKLEWAESLVKQEFPHLSDDDVLIIAEQRLESGYYTEYDF